MGMIAVWLNDTTHYKDFLNLSKEKKDALKKEVGDLLKQRIEENRGGSSFTFDSNDERSEVIAP